MLEKSARLLEKTLLPVTRAVNGFGSALLLGMVLLMSVNVFLRYVLRQPLRGTVELEEFMLVTVVFLGLAYTAVHQRHVRVDFLVFRLPRPAQALINAFTAFLSIGLCSLMVWRSAVSAWESWLHHKTSVLLQIPVSIFMGLASVGAALLFLVLLTEGLRTLAEVIAFGKRWVLGLVAGLLGALGLGFLVLVLQPSPNAIALLGFGLLLLMLALRMYIAFAMMLVGYLGMTYISGSAAGFYMMGTVPYTTTAAYDLCVIPFFVLMGYLCAVAGISTDMYNTAYKWLGNLRGGLAMGTVGACAAFAAVSGDSMGTAAVMGAAALPEMKRYNYSDSLATGCVAAGGTLGILIPPSMGFIIYAVIADQSISKLFMAGIFPGLLLTGLFMLVIYIQSLLDPSIAPPGPKVRFWERILSLKGTWSMILIFVLVIGGIYKGVFTPTEAGAIGATGALLIGLAKKRLRWANLLAALLETGRTVSMLFLLLIGARMLGYFLAGSEAPNQISAYISQLPLTRYALLAAILLLYLLIGCVMNILPAVIVTLPIVFPTVVNLGFDPIWFGVIMVIVMEMGLITPPVGMNVFVIKGVATDVSINTIYRGTFPFLIAMVACVTILTIFPDIALFLARATAG